LYQQIQELKNTTAEITLIHSLLVVTDWMIYK
jgi:hypothetical protein